MPEPERTEPATPRHREEVRERGQVARSAELTAAIVLIAALLYFRYQGLDFFTGLAATARSLFMKLSEGRLLEGQLIFLVQDLFIRLVVLLLPLYLILFLAALLANVIQVGFKVTGKPLLPKWERLNFTEGFKRIFSTRSIAELAKAVLKIGILTWVAFTTVRGEYQNTFAVMQMDQFSYLAFLGHLLYLLSFRLLLVLLVLAIIDYAYQRWEFERSIRMTRQEVRQEMKQTEGDPLIRGRIRQLQREMARRRMLTDLPTADVVITNPTHFAVALKYREEMSAPRVIAKGQRLIAQRIRALAFEHRIPVIENKALARILYEQAEVGRDIPVSLYQAVAGIIAFIYRLREGRSMNDIPLERPNQLVTPDLVEREA